MTSNHQYSKGPFNYYVTQKTDFSDLPPPFHKIFIKRATLVASNATFFIIFQPFSINFHHFHHFPSISSIFKKNLQTLNFFLENLYYRRTLPASDVKVGRSQLWFKLSQNLRLPLPIKRFSRVFKNFRGGVLEFIFKKSYKIKKNVGLDPKDPPLSNISVSLEGSVA